jgi:hypothetical protein
MDNSFWVDAGEGVHLRIRKFERLPPFPEPTELILDWEGIKRGGEEILFSKEEVEKVVKECPSLFDFVIANLI